MSSETLSPLLCKRGTSPILKTFSGSFLFWLQEPLCSMFTRCSILTVELALIFFYISNKFGINCYHNRSIQLTKYFKMIYCLSRKRRPWQVYRKNTSCAITDTIDTQFHEFTIEVCYSNYQCDIMIMTVLTVSFSEHLTCVRDYFKHSCFLI